MMPRISLSIICCGIMLAVGCQPAETVSIDNVNFGYFNGEVVATWNADGRKMTLINDFEYVDSEDRRWLAPAGTTVDGASIPGAFWTFIGGPFEGKYRYASVVHDIECERMTSSWEDVHRMFYEAMRCAGVSDSQAKTMYYAVYHFGPRWEPVEQSAAAPQELIEALPEARVARSKTGRRMRRYQPPPPTQEELDQLQNFIQEDNPNVVAIERTSRETLRHRTRRQPDADTSAQSARETVQSNAKNFAGVSSVRSQRNSRHNSRRELPSNQPQTNSASNSETVSSVVDQNERQWVIERVVNHFNSNQQIPATYDVVQSLDEYRVRMQVYSQTQRGEATGYQDEQILVRVSKAGDVLEILR